jgi:hypothetical protein
MRVRPAGHRCWDVTATGPRDIWAEIQDVAACWRAAGSPQSYRLEFGAGGTQRVTSASGTLSWLLPAPDRGYEGAR